MSGSLPRLWLVRARWCERGTCNRQPAPVVPCSRTLGQEGDTRQAAHPGHGWCAHAGAGRRHVTASLPQSWLVRNTPGRRGGDTRQARCPVAGRFAHSWELHDGEDAPADALAVAKLCTPGREDGRSTGQRDLVVACWRRVWARGWALGRAASPGRCLLAHAGAAGWALDRATRPGCGLLAYAAAGGWALDGA